MTRVLRAVRRFTASRPGPGVVAVSGGADSVALLCALHACGASVIVAHVNHRLRGEESDGDEAFVRELCATLDTECRIKSADVAVLAAGGNLESTARRVRYEFFADVARADGAPWVATAHTADDQAETVLHRLIRGTGLQGLRGIAAERRAEREEPNPPTPFPKKEGGAEPKPKTIAPQSPDFSPSPFRGGVGEGVLSGLSILRPLLTVTRVDVLAYLAEIGQPYRTDSTNADTRFTRNRIRHELLPLLKTFNPDVVSALTHLAEHAGDAHEVISVAAGELLARAERPRVAHVLVLDASVLAGAPRAVMRAALRLLWERESWPMSDMTFDAWERAVEVACRNAGACDFPGGISMRAAGRVVQLTRRE